MSRDRHILMAALALCAALAAAIPPFSGSLAPTLAQASTNTKHVRHAASPRHAPARVPQALPAPKPAPKTAAPAAKPAPRPTGPATGSEWLGAPSLTPAQAGSVDKHAGESYLIPKTRTTTFHSTSRVFQLVSSTYGNADNSPSPTASASNRPFNEKELTCASKTLPFGTLLAVSYRGKHAIVVVSDRGPYVSGRGLDLSTAAAKAIGLPGVATVQAVEVAPSD